jgi:hypothetical protein
VGQHDPQESKLKPTGRSYLAANNTDSLTGGLLGKSAKGRIDACTDAHPSQLLCAADRLCRPGTQGHH